MRSIRMVVMGDGKYGLAGPFVYSRGIVGGEDKHEATR